MKMENCAKKGYLEYYAKGNGAEHVWSKKFYVAYPRSETGVARLEYYDSESDYSNGEGFKRTVYLNGITDTRVAETAQKRYVFELVQAECPLKLSAMTKSDMDAWVSCLKELREVGRNELKHIDSPSVQIPTQEYNFYDSTDPPVVFQVEISQTADSERCKLHGTYDLLINITGLSLAQPGSKSPVYTWPFKYIRRYGSGKTSFTFESGRKSLTGPGSFKLISKDANQIVCLIQEHGKAVKAGGVSPLPQKRADTIGVRPPALPHRSYCLSDISAPNGQRLDSDSSTVSSGPVSPGLKPTTPAAVVSHSQQRLGPSVRTATQAGDKPTVISKFQKFFSPFIHSSDNDANNSAHKKPQKNIPNKPGVLPKPVISAKPVLSDKPTVPGKPVLSPAISIPSYSKAITRNVSSSGHRDDPTSPKHISTGIKVLPDLPQAFKPHRDCQEATYEQIVEPPVRSPAPLHPECNQDEVSCDPEPHYVLYDVTASSGFRHQPSPDSDEAHLYSEPYMDHGELRYSDGEDTYSSIEEEYSSRELSGEDKMSAVLSRMRQQGVTTAPPNGSNNYDQIDLQRQSRTPQVRSSDSGNTYGQLYPVPGNDRDLYSEPSDVISESEYSEIDIRNSN